MGPKMGKMGQMSKNVIFRIEVFEETVGDTDLNQKEVIKALFTRF